MQLFFPKPSSPQAAQDLAVDALIAWIDTYDADKQLAIALCRTAQVANALNPAIIFTAFLANISLTLDLNPTQIREVLTDLETWYSDDTYEPTNTHKDFPP